MRGDTLSESSKGRGRPRVHFPDPKLGKLYFDLNKQMTLWDIARRHNVGYQSVRFQIKAYRDSLKAEKPAEASALSRIYSADDVIDGFNQERVDRILDFIATLRVPPTRAGDPPRPPVITDDFMGRFIREVYGRSDADGGRRVRIALLSVARQNGKSLLASILVLAHLIGPEAIPRTQIACGATARQQAGIVFSKVVGIIGASGLEDKVKVLRQGMRITSTANDVIFTAVPREARTMQGYSLPFFVCDELAQHHDIDFYNALANSQGSFEEPLGLVISTKATHQGNPMGTLLEYSKAVDEGEIADPTWYAQVHSVEPDEDWEDEAIWRKANPGLGVSPKIEDLRAAYRKAKIITAERGHFQTYRLNMDSSISSRLFSAESWKACADPTIDLADLEGELCYAGLDLAEVRDMSSLALYFPEAGIVHTHQWLPTGMIAELQEASKLPFIQWAQDGMIDLIGDMTQDYGDLAVAIDHICQRFRVAGIAFDRYRMAQLEVKAIERGIRLPPMIEVSQSFRHMPAMLEAFERVLYDGKLRHPDNPALNMAATTVEYAQDKSSGSRKPLRPIASNVRIDPIIAAIMAVGLASRSRRTSTNRFAALAEVISPS